MIDERIPGTGKSAHGREDAEMATRYAQLQVNTIYRRCSVTPVCYNSQ